MLLTNFIIILVQILFGINFSASKTSLKVLDPYTFSFYRLFFGASLLYFISLFFEKNEVDEYVLNRKLLFICTLCLFLGQVFFVLGLKVTSSINASIISILIPVFTMIVSSLRGQVRITFLKVLGLFFAACGVFYLKIYDFSGDLGLSFWGDLSIVLACLSLSLYISFSKDLFTHYPVVKGTALIFFFSALMSLPLSLLFFNSSIEAAFSSEYLPSILYTLLGGTVLTYALNNWAIRKVNPFYYSIFIYLQPIVASVVGYYFLKEDFNIHKLIASALIFSGILLNTMERD